MTLAERFWPKVDKTPECWLWKACLYPDGYGALVYKGRVHGAHRLSWKLRYGRLPKQSVLHKCDVRNCVNPEHLFLGTQKTNMHDVISKGRWNPCVGKGEKNPAARFSEIQVKEIRRRAANGEAKRALAREFNTSDTLIRYMVSRRIWRDI